MDLTGWRNTDLFPMSQEQTPCEMNERTRRQLEQVKSFEDYVGRIAAERVSEALASVRGKLETLRGLTDDRTQYAHNHVSDLLDEIIDALTEGSKDDS